MAYFSYKQLACYLECPFQFKLQFMDRKPKTDDPRRPFIGNLLGTLVERMYVERWWAQPDLLQRLSAEVEPTALRLEQAEGVRWGAGERTTALTIVYAALPKIVATMKRERLVAPIVQAELDLEIPLDTDILLGRADLVFQTGDSVTVIDGKGGGMVGAHVKLNQLRFYVLGLYTKTGRIPERVGFWWFRHDLVKWHRVTPKSLQAFVAILRDAIARLRARDYTPRPGCRCRYCDVRQHCAVGQQHRLTHRVPHAEALAGKNEGLVSL